MKIRINAFYGFAGTNKVFEEEVPDDWNEEEIDECARDIVFEQVDWNWKKVAENEKG